MNAIERITAAVRDVADFPKPGIMFKDLTPVLADPALLELTHAELLTQVEDLRGQIQVVVGMESRGFWFGPGLARSLGAGFVPVRKPGKLPWKTREESYALEYGENTLEIHEDAVSAGTGVLIVDDLLATGGTANAARALVEGLGGKVLAYSFLVELDFLEGRAKLNGARVESLIHYD
jgi:adenine phosphoribosyltransferase